MANNPEIKLTNEDPVNIDTPDAGRVTIFADSTNSDHPSVKLSNGSVIDLAGVAAESDPVFTASAAAAVIDSGGGTQFLADDGTYKSIPVPVRTQTTGTTVTFTAEQVYNTATSPATGNITFDETSAVLGYVQKIYHNDTSVAFSGVGDIQLVGDGVYMPSELNVIYAEWTEAGRVEYWVVQEQ
jgi:hypothetical protein